jgi:hypothetical protein
MGPSGEVGESDGTLPTGHLGRQRPLALDAIHVFDVVPPALLPEQLVAEAQRIAEVPVALYALDIDGSHLLHMAGSTRLGKELEAPFAIGPELDADGIAILRNELAEFRGVELFALLVRRRGESGWDLDNARRRTGRKHARGRQQRRRSGCPAGEQA